MRCASPSTMAVLPTPGSPISTGLFLVRRESTCITRRISFCRPMTGSSFFSRACWVRLRPNWSSTSEPDGVSPWPAPWGPAPPDGAPSFASPVARQELDDLLAHAAEVGAERHEHLGGDALALTDEAEQQVLGADVVVAELERLAQRELEHLLGPGRERRCAAGGGARWADRLLHLLPDRLERDPERLERLGGDAFALVDQPEQDVLGAEEVVIEEPCFLLGEDQDSSGSVGEAFEQVTASISLAGQA